ncbi:hypothetical protein PGT21_008337 [Puccinia graminis f. sp. tritici]|uniref:Peptide N-acetyl-beta-D-glucosaminyl asparaginase amidase A N-terminal domain-containing protein n=1 Tax=Puccinia graminis f. sp. tritici TaxID=56615 RepID=A0A5B0MD36_PUCGR|nr:hypothetical protein PGT21_008337 [Puccinia graminis f. sp. tritici]
MFRISLPWIALWALLSASDLVHGTSLQSSSKQLHARQAVHRPNPLRNFEVREPPSVPKSQPCEVAIVEHTFVTSWGKPANASFTPPKKCGRPGSWASVIFNLTATSIGTQYDRVGMLYLNDIEVWRTSTAEPTKEGIVWTVTRDMTKYIPLLSGPASFSLDIGNTVDQSLDLTGSFEVTLSAKFYPPSLEFPAAKQADRILNMGHGSGNNMTSFMSFPQNIATAYLELFASGRGKEEYTNVPDVYRSKLDPTNAGTVTGKGSFREVQVWIDNRLAGVAYPFPVIYTGGILLAWWRPIAAIGAFDAPTYVLDISPFVPLLADSKPHNFTLRVVGQGENGSINEDWVFSAAVFVGLDPSATRTTGSILTHFTDSKTTVEVPKDIRIPPNLDPKSLTSFTTRSFRQLSISSSVVTGTGELKIVKVEQDMTFVNQQTWAADTAYQSIVMTSQGNSISTHGDTAEKIDNFRYPFNLTLSALAVPSATKIVGHLNHKYSRSQVFPFSSSLGKIGIETTQDAAGELVVDQKGRALSGLGRTIQSFTYEDGKGGSYARDVDIYNSTKTIRDKESGTLLPAIKTESLTTLSVSNTPLETSLLSTDSLSTNGPAPKGLPENAFSTSAISFSEDQHLHGDETLRGAPCKTLHTPAPRPKSKTPPQ